MEEDSPWGAPTSFPTPRLSPPLAVHHSPPLSTSTTSTPLPSWGIDDGGGGWGNDTAVEEEEYGSFSLGVQGTQESTSSTIDSPPPPRKESTGDAWGNSTFQESDDTEAEAITSNDIQRRGDNDNDNDLPPIDSTLSPAITEDVDVHEDDDRGWIPSTPPLPPIQTLEISSSSSSPKEATFSSNSNSWEPGSFDDDQALPPPPLPSVKDLFSSSSTGGTSTDLGDGFGGERRESVGDGEEAWGAARGWEERQEKERQMELEQQEEEFRREVEAEEDDVTEEERREIERKVREAEEAAERGEDNWGGTTAETGTRTRTSQAGERGHKGDEFDLDNPEKLKQEKKKASWWSRSRSENSRREDGVEDAVNETKQEERIQPQSTPQQVESRTSTEETQNQQVGTIGRLFGRFKKTQTNSATSDGGGSTRTSAEQNRNPSSTTETKPPQNDSWQDQDFDALGSGKFGTKNQLQPHQLEIEEEEEVSGGVGRFFGDRTGSGGRGIVKSRARIPTAPPEDDFGGLLGSFSTAPVVSPAAPKPKTSKPFDPFDPLSEPSPQIAKMTVNPSPALKRPISSFAIPSPTTTSTSTSPPSTSSGDDSFDAFFDSVTSSISKPPLSSIPTPPLPSTQRPPSLIVPRASSSSSTSAKRAPLASPIPRMSTTSPPLRSPASSSNVSSRATTPILPLAPPPPPSQPLAQRNNLLGSLATPSNQSIVRPNSISPPPPPLSVSAVRSSSPLEPKKGPIPAPATVRGNSGPLSRDDLDFFENL